MRDASRDQIHGRIYRITAKNRPLQKPVSIYGEPVEKLLELFKSPVDGIRHSVRVELSGRNTDEVIRKAQKWASTLDPQKKENALPLLEILWLHQQHNVVNRELLVQVLKSPEEQARIAAQKVAWFWSDRETHRMGGTDSQIWGMQFRTFYEKFWSAQDSSSARETAHNKHQVDLKKKVAEKPDVLNKKLDLRDNAIAVLNIEAAQLHFNVAEFTVEAGQSVELTLDNLDLMQHNLLIVEPGSADEIAQLAIDLGEKGLEKHYIPDSKKVLYSTRLLNANSKETIKFKAPLVPGDYQFVCTFPGHAPVMRGIMRVMN